MDPTASVRFARGGVVVTLRPAWAMAQQLASGLYRNLAEFVRSCAAYLGITVLVAGTMVLTMPTLRGQALQIHSALLYALVPDALLPQPVTNTGGPVGPIVAAIDLEPLRGEALPPATGANPSASAQRPAPRVEPALPGQATVQQELAAAAEASAASRGLSVQEAVQRQGLAQKQQDALIQYLSRKYLVANEAAKMFVETAYVVGDELKVDPLLILAIIAIESRFNPYAGGQVGGPTGLMQVMISVHRDKFTKLGRAESLAFNPVANIRVGAFILADCIRRRGSVAEGLLCYCGASGPTTDGGYTEKVLSERRRLALAGSIALKD